MSEPTPVIPTIDPSNLPAPAQSTASVLDDITDSVAIALGEKKAPEPKPAPKPAEPAKAAEPAKPSEAPAEPKSGLPDMKAITDDADVPANLSPKAAENFKKIKLEKEAIKKELSTLRAQLEQQGKTPTASQPELEQLKKERDELSRHLQELSIERHPQFQAYFTGRKEQALNSAKLLVGPEKGDHVTQLLNLPDSPYKQAQLNELMSELSPIQQGQLGAVMLKLSEVDMERNAELSKASQNYNRIQQQAQQQQAQQQQEYERSFNAIVEQHREIPVFATKEGDESWNQSVNQRLALAKDIYTGNLPPQERARASLWASAAPEFLNQANRLQQENATLRAELEALRGSSPAIGGPSSTGGGDSNPSTGDYVGSVEAAVKQALGPRW